MLRDGASAIYGADAVAGVVNYVLNSDFEGARVRVKHAQFENIPRTDITLIGEWGRAFNEGRTNLSVFAQHYQRDRVNSQDDPRWGGFRFPLASRSGLALGFRNGFPQQQRQLGSIGSSTPCGASGDGAFPAY